jgi:glycosyltransferase involved in cell wall biosynthesis
VLIITDLAGLLRYQMPRIPALVKLLPQFGWQPLILTKPLRTTHDLECTIVETEYRDNYAILKKVLNLNSKDNIDIQIKEKLGLSYSDKRFDSIYRTIAACLTYPDGEKGWKRFAIQEARQLLDTSDIDVLLSSSPPVTSHVIAHELKKKYELPWIADLRDLWSQNHNYGYGAFRKVLDERLERRILSRADFLTTVSPVWAEKLKRLHKRATVCTIHNGFDSNVLERSQTELSPKFLITYVGGIYHTKQDPVRLFVSLKELIANGLIQPEDVEVKFYGSEYAWLQTEIEKYGLSLLVKQYGQIPKNTAIDKQRESQLLLFLNWEDHREKGLYAQKIYDYLSAQRPILSLGGSGNDVIEQLLDETKAGEYCTTIEEANDALAKFYREYKRSGKVPYRGDLRKINQYSHIAMTKKFAQLFERISRDN